MNRCLALEESPYSFNFAHFTLGQTDPYIFQITYLSKKFHTAFC
ncbi:hypothetical protein Patl1_28437 [Pistacia atlantica]|uniref:Uncharacterized protein n=1 Tax=Pistacia atlantica TaxID=434234 RepID=A0ACC1BBT2_9ROSI|nr:hypothetical protein Patl1_28437 [Pistacia atlantica]